MMKLSAVITCFHKNAQLVYRLSCSRVPGAHASSERVTVLQLLAAC
jgi:hypothetical protein